MRDSDTVQKVLFATQSGHHCRKYSNFLVTLLRVSKPCLLFFLVYQVAESISNYPKIKLYQQSRLGNLQQSCRVPATPAYK